MQGFGGLVLKCWGVSHLGKVSLGWLYDNLIRYLSGDVRSECITHCITHWPVVLTYLLPSPTQC